MRRLISLCSMAICLLAQTAEPPKPTFPAEKLSDSLRIREGQVVAEFGANEDVVQGLRKRVGALGKLIVGEIHEEGDPKLAVASVDVLLLNATALHTADADKFLMHVHSSIKPAGRLFVVLAPKEVAQTTPRLNSSGFRFVASTNLSPEYALLEFARP